MPVQKAIKDYQIRNLRLDMDRQGMYLSLVCPAAYAYLLCFTNGKPVCSEMLELTEEELTELCCNQAAIDKGEYRLQGVRSRTFNAAAQFRDFHAVPPERIQVWAMSYNSFRNIATLYVPERAEDQLVFLPMRYSFVTRRDGIYSLICVKLLDQGIYEEGALMYKVGSAAPIPLPPDAMGRELRINNPADEIIQIVTETKYTGRYKQA